MFVDLLVEELRRIKKKQLCKNNKLDLVDAATTRELLGLSCLSLCLARREYPCWRRKELADFRTLLFTDTCTCSLSTCSHPLFSCTSFLAPQHRPNRQAHRWEKMSNGTVETRLQPHQRLSFDGSSRSLRDGTSRRSSRDCSPRERYARDRSPRDRSPPRSPLRTRRAPSPLRHAQFRPLAMEYAISHENSPQPTSCKYYNAAEEEEETPGGTPGEYCSTYRTVG